MNVTLPPDVERFVREKVQSGSFPSPNEVIVKGLSLLRGLDEARQRRLEELRQKIDVGIEQADRGELLDGEEVFRELEAELADTTETQP